MMINWTKPEDKISKYFTVKDACFLPSWGVLHIASEKEQQNILKQAGILDKLIDDVGLKMKIHCWMRPTSANCPESKWHGQNYNKAVGSTSTKSSHITGMGTDFHFEGKETAEECLEMREKKLLPLLDKYKIRMEKKSGSWIHIDHAPVISNRYFPA